MASGLSRTTEESKDSVKAVVYGVTISAKRLQQTASGCKGSASIVTRFLKGTTAHVSKVGDCAIHCTQSGYGDVFQLTSAGQESTGNNRICSCSSVQANYFNLFPTRYLQCVSNSVDVFYRTDRLSANWATLTKPLLFYALDDVSGITNIGTVDAASSTPVWLRGQGYYDCQFRDSNASPSRPKLMRLVPAEQPLLRIIHNLPLTADKGYSAMAWFKKRDPSVGQLPIIDGTQLNEATYSWHMWNWVETYQIYWYHAKKTLFLDNVIDQAGWNHQTMRVQGNSFLGDINGKQLASMTFDPKDAVFGDRFTIGSRQITNDGLNNHVFDGCLGHIIIFNKTLSLDEAKLYSTLVADDDF